jgi:hypothetical protein
MLDAGGLEIAKRLGDVFVGNFADGFQFNDKTPVHEEIGVIIAQKYAVFVVDLYCFLLFDAEPEFA